MTVKAKVRVTVDLEIEIDASWSDDCTCGQVMSQARRESTSVINKFCAVGQMAKIGGHRLTVKSFTAEPCMVSVK